jgi:hypothetical protein
MINEKLVGSTVYDPKIKKLPNMIYYLQSRQENKPVFSTSDKIR